MDESPGTLYAWDILNDVDNNSTYSGSETESIRDYGEIIAAFDILWKRGACDEGGPDGQWNGEQITIRRFDPFALANPDELDTARNEGRPLKDIYRAYFVFGNFRGTYACTVSPCRHHFTHFKRLRENRGLRARTGNNPMEFGTVDWVRDDRGAPFLRWVMPPGNGHLKSEGWAKQRRPGNAPDSQHAILTQAEGDRLRAEILRVQRETSQFYVDRYRERQAQQESQNADEDDRKGLELGGEGSGS